MPYIYTYSLLKYISALSNSCPVKNTMNQNQLGLNCHFIYDLKVLSPKRLNLDRQLARIKRFSYDLGIAS